MLVYLTDVRMAVPPRVDANLGFAETSCRKMGI
jgi:hypothetical protein